MISFYLGHRLGGRPDGRETHRPDVGSKLLGYLHTWLLFQFYLLGSSTRVGLAVIMQLFYHFVRQ